MTDEQPEVRTIFPLTIFNRPRLGQTAGQKEGLIPDDVASILPPDRVVDFRPKVIASEVELPVVAVVEVGEALTNTPCDIKEKHERHDYLWGEYGSVDYRTCDGDGEPDPKDPASSATISAVPFVDAQLASTTQQTTTLTPTENPTSLSGLPATPATAEKEAPVTIGGLQTRTIGALSLPAEITGETPEAS